ncbi:uncharacterized protein LOC131210367 [Anopheles bellator]|uniref:uncharacterized protein LOC131210367 n=1 Tax=Anopheles bellator TaxID=139047 RepID=UPI002648FA05|nr:uncharacterized protein LOC131210367 [Anopheles bellator]
MHSLGSILMQICVIAASIQSGLSIKCYNCDSTSNEECMDLKSNSAITAEICTPSKMASTTGNWLADLTRIEYFGGAEITVPMVCQKIVATNENGDMMTFRGCQLDGGKTDPCQIAYGKAKQQRGINIEFCSTCKEDGCNAAPRTGGRVPLGLLLLGSLMALAGSLAASRKQQLL